ncbi:MAG TPA: divalent-cation tolerance protein CutA [Usitatibacteraceae bacterium]|nr:divalent-cation tolerance protein CutA [Usitatibacteraceae bacterium]
MAVIAVLTNLPDSESAFNLARTLVRRRLAACVNVLGPATSFYRWDGREEEARETPVLIKSTRECYPELERVILELHPYTLPEIIAFPAELGLENYLGWVRDECKPDPEPGATP